MPIMWDDGPTATLDLAPQAWLARASSALRSHNVLYEASKPPLRFAPQQIHLVSECDLAQGAVTLLRAGEPLVEACAMELVVASLAL